MKHLLLLVLLPLLSCPRLARAEDATALRPLEVKRFGVSPSHPPAWKLILWGRDEKAFVLKLPQEEAREHVGFVACELAMAPESLEEYRRRHQASDEKEQKSEKPRRKLTVNKIEPAKANDNAEQDKKAGKPPFGRLISVWEYPGADGKPAWYEIRVRLVRNDLLYTFILSTDEAHFEAYRCDFDDMIAAAWFREPETGLAKLPSGYWMQRKLRFALKLPPGWKPAFGPDDRVLFYATGKTKEVWKDNLIVTASKGRPTDLAQLRERMPAALKRTDARSKVERCEFVEQGDAEALETIVHTTRGPWKMTVLERRFRGKNLNFEVRFTCETGQFEKIKAELEKTLDSFIEIKQGKKPTVL